MATLTKVNGFLNNYVTGTVFQNANLGFYQATIRSTSNGSNTAIDLRAEDGDAAGEADQKVELIVKSVNAIGYFAKDANDGICLLYTSPSPRD